MMPRFGTESERRLATCHPALQAVLRAAIEHAPDFVVLTGYRDREAQEDCLRRGVSKAAFGRSLHNRDPSLAVDIAPWHREPPHVRWRRTEEFVRLAGWIEATAQQLGVRIRWGGDWDGDGDQRDQTLHDLGHFELMGEHKGWL